ncbi:MAG TPA: dienelactone hydrolase family protein [Acidimicrobiales bacterium]|nr:dienelactone hydrolase family protein [Acidimicrobiales bacterium]
MRTELPSGTPVELARPPGTPSAGLVIAPDIGGLRPLFDDLCSRLAAEQGWVVAAPEPFPGRQEMTLEERMAAVGGLDDERQVGDLLAAADLTGQERVGLIGFCMGGMYVHKAAATGRFDAAVSFYGMIRIPENWRGEGHTEPLDALARPGHTPVLAIVGRRDPYTPPADVEALRGMPGVEVVEYPEAEHGFVHDPSRPAHRPDDAADAWDRAIRWLAAPAAAGR